MLMFWETKHDMITGHGSPVSSARPIVFRVLNQPALTIRQGLMHTANAPVDCDQGHMAQSDVN
jgi:hypothetical protein